MALLRSLALPLMACALFGNAQNVINSRTAAVVPYWEKGDRFVYKVDRTKKEFEGTTVSDATSSAYTLTMTVTDTTGGEYTIESVITGLTVDAGDMGEATPEQQRIIKKMMTMTEGLRVLYKTDDVGNVLSVLNGPELVKQVRSMFDELVKVLPEEDRATFQTILETVTTQEVVETGALEDAQRLHYAFGGEYTLGERLSSDVEIDNPLGGDPLAAKLTMSMNTLDPTKETATFSMEQKIDPEKLMAMLTDLMNAIGGGEMDPKDRAEAEKEIKAMKITDSMNTNVDLKGATINTLSYKREVSVLGTRSVETYEYRLVR